MNSTAELLTALKSGQMIVLLDDEQRENEGDLVMLADCVTPQAINFMARYARGLICLALSERHCQRLRLPLMVPNNNQSKHRTKFTLSIEARHGVSTGISAADRAHTIKTAVDENHGADDLVQPGHVFPLMAENGGVLTRAGHTEAAVDLARLAGRSAAGVLVEIMNDDGSMARRDQLMEFAHHHKLCIGTIADLIAHRLHHEKTISRVNEQKNLSSKWGEFRLVIYQDLNKTQHLALVKGQINSKQSTAVRVHLVEPLRDLLGIDCDKSWSFNDSLDYISQQKSGVMVLIQSPHSLELPDHLAHKKKPATQSSYLTVGIGSQILRDLGVQKMRLLSHPAYFGALSGFGLEISEFLPPLNKN